MDTNTNDGIVDVNKPALAYDKASGKLTIKASAALDMDKDDKPSIEIATAVVVDAKEVVSEILKDGLPAWMKAILGKIGIGSL